MQKIFNLDNRSDQANRAFCQKKKGNRLQFTVIGSRLKKQKVEKNYKVYKYCSRIGCGAENTGLYFTRG